MGHAGVLILLEICFHSGLGRHFGLQRNFNIITQAHEERFHMLGERLIDSSCGEGLFHLISQC